MTLDLDKLLALLLIMIAAGLGFAGIAFLADRWSKNQ